MLGNENGVATSGAWQLDVTVAVSAGILQHTPQPMQASHGQFFLQLTVTPAGEYIPANARKGALVLIM